jgi:hypothetical protein
MMEPFPFAVGQRVKSNGDYKGSSFRGIVKEQVSSWFVRVIEDGKNSLAGCSTTMLEAEADDSNTTTTNDQAV